MRACVLFLCLLATPACISSSFAAHPVLRVALDVPYAPFAVYDEKGELTGFDVEIGRALCKELQRECIFVIAAFDELIPFIVADKADIAIAGMAISAERKKLVDFTDKYFRTLSTFISYDNPHAIISSETLKGKRVAIQSGTMQDDYLKNTMPGIGAIIPMPGFPETLEILRQGKADFALVDSLAAYSFLKTPQGKGYEAVGDPVSLGGMKDSAAIAVSKKQPELRKALNDGIQALRRSGEYGRINRKYFDFPVY